MVHSISGLAQHKENPVQIHLSADLVISQGATGTVFISRPNMHGRIATHAVHSEYDAFDIARWMWNRRTGHRTTLVQVAFPNMRKDDREFLMTGITPTEWSHMFRQEEDTNG